MDYGVTCPPDDALYTRIPDGAGYFRASSFPEPLYQSSLPRLPEGRQIQRRVLTGPDREGIIASVKRKQTPEEDLSTAYHEAGHAVAYMHFERVRVKSISIKPDAKAGTDGRTMLDGKDPFHRPDQYGDCRSNTSAACLSNCVDELVRWQKAVSISIRAISIRAIADRSAWIAEELRAAAGYLAQQEYLMERLAGEAATFILSGKRDPIGAGRWPKNLAGDTRAVWRDLEYRFEVRAVPEARVEREAQAYLRWLWQKTINLLMDPKNWIAVEALAAALIKRRTLSGAEAEAVVKEARFHYGLTPEQIARLQKSEKLPTSKSPARNHERAEPPRPRKPPTRPKGKSRSIQPDRAK